MVVNDTNINMEVSTYPISMLHNSASGLKNCTTKDTEEIFENQCYQPNSGWSNCPDKSRNSDVEHWSTRDFSLSSKVILHPSYIWVRVHSCNLLNCSLWKLCVL